MTTRNWRLLVHVIAPVAITLPLILAYASNDQDLMDMVASERLGREFGILEGLQTLLLLVCTGVLVTALCRARERTPRILLGILTAMTVFLLLEETDYGKSYYEWLTGAEQGTPDDEFRTVHHKLRSTGNMKRALDAIVVLGFVILPLVVRRAKTAWLRFLRPTAWFIASVAVMYSLSKVAHWLIDDMRPMFSLRKNVSEFRELVLYWMFFVYYRDLLARTRLIDSTVGGTVDGTAHGSADAPAPPE